MHFIDDEKGWKVMSTEKERKSSQSAGAKNKTKKQNYRIEQEQENGVVKIADEVIASIAGIAATEVEGVVRLTGNITNEIVSKIGMNVLSKGVHVAIHEDQVRITLNCEILYGSSIPEVSAAIQDKVKQSVENMTGLTVEQVDVYVAAVTEIK